MSDSTSYGRDLLATELAFFNDNQTELLAKYANRYLVIHGDRIEGHYETFRAALKASMAKHGSEPVLIRRPGDKTRTLVAPALTLGIM